MHPSSRCPARWSRCDLLANAATNATNRGVVVTTVAAEEHLSLPRHEDGELGPTLLRRQRGHVDLVEDDELLVEDVVRDLARDRVCDALAGRLVDVLGRPDHPILHQLDERVHELLLGAREHDDGLLEPQLFVDRDERLRADGGHPLAGLAVLLPRLTPRASS